MTGSIPHSTTSNELSPPRTAPDPADETEQVYPPQSLGRLYILVYVTLGLYAPFWGYRLTRDLNALAGRNYSPPANWFGYLIPVLRWFLMARHLRDVETLAKDNRYRWFSPGAVVGLMVLVDLLTGAANLFENLVWPLMATLLTYPLPFLLAQHQVNLVKEQKEPRRYRGKAYAFSVPQIIAVVLFIPLTGLMLWLSGEELFDANYPVVAAGTPVDIGHGLRFSAPGGWRLAEPTKLNDDAEFSMLGPSSMSYALVYSHEDDVDDVVDFRRDAIRSDGHGFTATEVRRFLAGTSRVASYATYEINDMFGKTRWVVTTVELDDRVVELLTTTDDVDKQYAALDTISRTLQPGPES